MGKFITCPSSSRPQQRPHLYFHIQFNTFFALYGFFFNRRTLFWFLSCRYECSKNWELTKWFKMTTTDFLIIQKRRDYNPFHVVLYVILEHYFGTLFLDENLLRWKVNKILIGPKLFFFSFLSKYIAKNVNNKYSSQSQVMSSQNNVQDDMNKF